MSSARLGPPGLGPTCRVRMPRVCASTRPFWHCPTLVDSSSKLWCLFLFFFFVSSPSPSLSLSFNKVDCIQPVPREEPSPATKFQSIGVQVEDDWR